MTHLLKIATLLLLAMVSCIPVVAQETYPSTICNPDGTVTFQYRNKQAKEVMVDVQFAGRKPMTRDAKTGLWTATIGPAAPDMYPYCFIVDGISVMDPMNCQYFPNEGFKNSLLEISAKNGTLAHDIKSVPHGIIHYIHYYSSTLQTTNNAVVYLPPSYDEKKQERYPVFYLISGTTDTEEVYYKVGRMNYILDNLLAEGLAKEMIIVLPYGNPTKLLPPGELHNQSLQPSLQFGGDPFSKDVINDLMPYIEQNYRTINDRDHRAIGGFSRGGNQGLSIGLSNIDKFSYLCSYSSFTSTSIKNVYDNAADTNSKLHLFWLGVGTDDFLYGNARDYMAFLDQKGIRSVKEFTNDKFGHTWMNAKFFLDKTLRLLFNPDAAEAAMKEGKPAPAATGKEPQFTPGVMARMFPRPVISPEYTRDAVTFRIKAEDVSQVCLMTEFFDEPRLMVHGDDNIWSLTLKDHLLDTFEYYFIVDGTKVADPNNMYLSPCKGFKPSYTNSPFAPYSFSTMGKMEHGHVSYDLTRQQAVYGNSDNAVPVVSLLTTEDMTMESWFKVGGADAIADKLIAEGKIRPCVIRTGISVPSESNDKTTTKILSLNAADYKTWPERREALIKLLTTSLAADK